MHLLAATLFTILMPGLTMRQPMPPSELKMRQVRLVIPITTMEPEQPLRLVLTSRS